MLTRFLNILSVAVVLVSLGFAGYRWYKRSPRSPERGDLLAVGGVDWKENGHTVIVALATTCQFCKQEAGFHRRLAALAGRSRGFISVFQESPREAQTFLNSEHLPSRFAANVSFSKLAVEGTPTVILADKDGAVLKSWFGKLSEAQHKDVEESLRAVFGDRTTQMISPERLAADQTTRNKQWVILDSRSRQDFAAEHIRDAVNIPMSELPARAPVEISPETSVALYCGGASCRQAELTLASVSVIVEGSLKGTLAEASAAGLATTQSPSRRERAAGSPH